MAAIKYYRGQFLDEESQSVCPEEHDLWEEPIEAEGDGIEEAGIFVASLQVNVEVLADTGGPGQGSLGRVEVRKVIFREA